MKRIQVHVPARKKLQQNFRLCSTIFGTRGITEVGLQVDTAKELAGVEAQND